MLDWFEKEAPIRRKFRVLLTVLTVYAALGLAASLLSDNQMIAPNWAIATQVAMVILTVLTVAVAAEKICTPYVSTVERMEALARGDLASAVKYVDHQDCVGRLTRAMATFRDAMERLNEARANEQAVSTALSSALRALAANRLDCEITEPLPDAYEALRADFNAAIKGLAHAMSSVRQCADAVLGGATEIHSAADDMAQRNEQHAASLRDTATAMNGITDGVRDSAAAADEVRKSIAAAHHEASEGGTVVSRAVGAMDGIEKSASEISQIIGVIDGIAFQTNLLALNAGVEAARAGDAGKGFAVVANEVRALAQRSADAAKDIKALITVSNEQVGAGVALVGETGSLLSRIATRVGDINTLIGDIAGNAARQAEHLQRINATVGEMDTMTQRNAAMVEQSTAAARSLSDEARELSQVVGRFHTANDAVTPFVRAKAAPSRARAAPVRAASARAAPSTAGNLALKASGDDWSQF